MSSIKLYPYPVLPSIYYSALSFAVSDEGQDSADAEDERQIASNGGRQEGGDDCDICRRPKISSLVACVVCQHPMRLCLVCMENPSIIANGTASDKVGTRYRNS